MSDLLLKWSFVGNIAGKRVSDAMNNHTGHKIYRLLIGLWLITVVITGCGSIQARNEQKLEGKIVADLLKTLGESVETATATEEEESFVLNHFRNLWHYMQVSARTTITFKRLYYSGWGKEIETILADIELPQFGLVQITVIDNDGVSLVVDALSYQYLVGSTVDFEEGLAGARFIIKNPNAQSTCGCGASFSV